MIWLKKILPTLSLLLALPACATAPLQPVQGQVLEEGTNKPIARALVVGRWMGTVTHGIVESRTVCYHVESTVTDSEGRFTLPPTDKEYRYRDGDHYTSITAYKSSYQSARVQRSQRVTYLQPFTGTREERLAYLSRVAVSCSDKKETEINLLPLYKALYEEAKNLTVTKKEDKLKVLYRLRDVERLELGTDKAWENFRQRERELK